MPGAFTPPQIDRLLVTLRLRRAARLHFNHGGVLRGLVSAALRRHEVPAGLIPFACESGRVSFEPGEPYRLGFTLVGESQRLAEELIRGLEVVGGHEPPGGQGGVPPTLGGNFDVSLVRPLGPAPIGALQDLVAASSRVCLRFISPMRLKRPAELATPHEAYVNGQCFPAGHFLDRLFQRVMFVLHGQYPDAAARRSCPALPPGLEADVAGRLLWVDVPIEGRGDDPRRPRGYTLGGILGTVTLAGVSPDWASWLTLGRHLHVGESTAYGFGRFVFCMDGVEDDEPFRPSLTAAERLADGALLEAALAHVVEHSDAAGVDGVTPEQFRESRAVEIRALTAELAGGRYAPQPARGILTRKHDGRLRPLVVPTVRDRVVERAACELLGPAIDTLLEDCSFAYRKGFSRQGAARAVARAWDDGFRYVLDADIGAFFDSVDWRRLFAKLHALFPFDPIVGLLKQWVRTPVEFDRAALGRHRGLPQGLPVSPMLANLYLDELDEELLGKDYRLVRYADDFVVLCRDPEAALAAKRDVQLALERLGLVLNLEKTAIVGPDQPFSYLGYLFCGPVVMESGHEDSGAGCALPDDAVPAASWLAQVPMERVRALAPGVSESRDRPSPVVSLHAQGPAVVPARRPLHVMTHDTTVALRSGRVRVERPGLAPDEFPVAGISHVVLYGQVRVSLALVTALNNEGIPVFGCRHTGEMVTAFVPHAPDWSVWLDQARHAEDPRARLDLARRVVMAKLHNYAWFIRRAGFEGAGEALEALTRLEDDCEGADAVDRLVGFEGRGAAIYFGVLGASLDPAWRFAGRHHHPAPDPVNAMLSFGYTSLYHRVSTALVAAGLNPRIGVLHRARGRHLALASDLMEEFRHLIDGFVLGQIRRRRVRPTDFIGGNAAPCLMTPAMRQEFVRRLEHRWVLPVMLEGVRTTHLEQLDRQVGTFRRVVTGAERCYRPFRAAERASARKEAPISPP